MGLSNTPDKSSLPARTVDLAGTVASVRTVAPAQAGAQVELNETLSFGNFGKSTWGE
jgi:hypothetical protein